MSFTSYSVDNDRAFRNSLLRARQQVSDLTLPLTFIAKDWFRSNKAIFALKGPGQYPDLKPKYKIAKQKNWGFIYPILLASGRLSGSLLDPKNPESINYILNKDTLVVGTKVPYGIYHQSDEPRSKIPLRKFLFIGPESQFNSNGDVAGRLTRWLGYLNGYVLAKMQQQGFGVKE